VTLLVGALVFVEYSRHIETAELASFFGVVVLLGFLTFHSDSVRSMYLRIIQVFQQITPTVETEPPKVETTQVDKPKSLEDLLLIRNADDAIRNAFFLFGAMGGLAGLFGLRNARPLGLIFGCIGGGAFGLFVGTFIGAAINISNSIANSIP